MSRYLLPLCLIACLLITAAQAQTPSPTPPQLPPTREAPSRGGTASAPPAASEQLSRSGSVIKPPDNVDRKIEAPTPNPGPQSMPIVPPPGLPGGNPDVKPK
ncbi:MAG TPA: hypothetical protein VHT04_03620 [Stellaceae bacterium]|nr:hypothetical protein [Stellaceae bacterium]